MQKRTKKDKLEATVPKVNELPKAHVIYFAEANTKCKALPEQNSGSSRPQEEARINLMPTRRANVCPVVAETVDLRRTVHAGM